MINSQGFDTNNLPVDVRENYGPIELDQITGADNKEEGKITLHFTGNRHHVWQWGADAPGQGKWLLIGGNYIRHEPS